MGLKLSTRWQLVAPQLLYTYIGGVDQPKGTLACSIDTPPSPLLTDPSTLPAPLSSPSPSLPTTSLSSHHRPRYLTCAPPIQSLMTRPPQPSAPR